MVAAAAPVGKHQRLLRRRKSGRGSDLVPDLRPRLDRSDHLVQDTELLLPCLDHRREALVDGHQGLDLRPLVGIECAEGIFRGERDMVFAVGHHSSPRHSRISIMLRRSQVFTVFTGVSNLAANCSRLQPL